MSDSLVIYHGGCRDGWASAWVLHKVMPDAVYYAGHYGQPPPFDLISGKDVYIVDFSYKRAALIDVAQRARSLVVLDHHKTAMDELSGLADGSVLPVDELSVHFNMDKSGVGMAWDHFFPETPRPWLVDYVEDRDLWLKGLPFSDAANAYISTIEFDFDEWDKLEQMSLEEAVVLGRPVVAKTQQYVREVLKNAMRVNFCGYVVPIVNAPQVDISELLHELAKRPFKETLDIAEPPEFAMGWWQRSDGRFQYSLRSIGDFDVSKLAKDYDGGGHKNAAGFERDSPDHLWWGV